MTSEATSELELGEGEKVWVAIKATEIGVEAGGGHPFRVTSSCSATHDWRRPPWVRSNASAMCRSGT